MSPSSDVALRWGVVTSVNPLRVRRDYPDSLPPNAPPNSLVADLRVGDRVLLAEHGRQFTVIGRSGGFSIPPPPDPLPAPVDRRGSTSNTVTSTTWADVAGMSADIVLPAAALCLVTYSARMRSVGGAATDLRAHLAWSGATSGDINTDYGWHNVLYQGASPSGGPTFESFMSNTISIPFAKGRTTVKMQAFKIGSGNANDLRYPGWRVTPLSWL